MMNLRNKKPQIKVEILSKPDCHLCDMAKDIITDVRSKIPFDLEIIDITTDHKLLEKYREQIPVILINGRKAFKYRVERNEFIKRLKRIHQTFGSV